MLLLSRRIGEKIIVGEDIEIVVVGLFGQQVRLGINAPANIAIHREEIFRKIKAGNGRCMKAK